MIQRVEVSSVDIDAGPRRGQGRAGAAGGRSTVSSRRRRCSCGPGAVERWRVLNASVDGRGFKQFMVLEGQFVFADRQLWRVLPGEKEGAPRRFEAATRQDVADADAAAVSVVVRRHHARRDRERHARVTRSAICRKQNAGTRNPLDRQPAAGEEPARAMLKNVEDCYRDGDSLRNLFVRPNEVFLANANRADVFFKAPLDAAGKVYTVFAQEFPLATDNFQQRLPDRRSPAAGTGFTTGNPAPVDVVVGYVKVAGEAVPGGDFDVMRLRDKLPPVPPFLQPVEDERAAGAGGGSDAARRAGRAVSGRASMSYSGYGPTDFPLIEVPEAIRASSIRS